MGYKYVTASASIQPGRIMVTSVVATPNAQQASGTCTLYNATAATANTEVLKLNCGTAGQSVSWSDPKGIMLSNLYVAVTCATATVVWD